MCFYEFLKLNNSIYEVDWSKPDFKTAFVIVSANTLTLQIKHFRKGLMSSIYLILIKTKDNPQQLLSRVNIEKKYLYIITR